MVITDQLADQQKILKLAILVYNRFFNQPYQTLKNLRCNSGLEDISCHGFKMLMSISLLMEIVDQ